MQSLGHSEQGTGRECPKTHGPEQGSCLPGSGGNCVKRWEGSPWVPAASWMFFAQRPLDPGPRSEQEAPWGTGMWARQDTEGNWGSSKEGSCLFPRQSQQAAPQAAQSVPRPATLGHTQPQRGRVSLIGQASWELGGNEDPVSPTICQVCHPPSL